ncbi:MAG: hypothetical protein HY879_01660 [Deltaproteobacteria bacterium]|nr:hypothetical protein [Deltaproteobacteria bacterium]
MKKIIGLLSIFLMLTLLMPVKPAEARGGGGGFLPGLIIGGVLGWGLSPRYYPPAYYYPPPPRYYYPPPEYYYPPPEYRYPPPRETGQTPPSGGRMFVYPRQGQSEEQQGRDRDECHNWAVNQTGYDPAKPLDIVPDDQTIQKSVDFFRAISACLDARGYTVR